MTHIGSMHRAALGAAAITAVMVLAGCASPPNNDRTELREAGDGFPALDSNWYDGGRFVEPENILRISEGQTKDQVRQLIGNPHFSEGFFGVREWNYVFNLYTGESGGDYITCQYQVHFDDDMALDNTRWRDVQCPALLVPIEVEAIEADEVRHDVTLSADLLFAFDSAQLTLEGRRGLDNLVHILQHDFSRPDILIRGYTDRLGSAEYNQTLSEQRAAAVKAQLVSQGVPAETVRTVGMGARDAVVECPGTRATPALTQCLQPNRRVAVEIVE